MSAEPAPAAPKKKRKWPIFVFLLLLMGGAGGGAWYYFMVMAPQVEAEAADAPPAPEPTIYFELRPAFVANLVGGRFLQVELDLMARDQAVIDAVIMHNPAIRNEILLLLGSQKPSTIESLDGKLAVQKAVTESINGILAKRENGLQVEEVYFSSFVMQ